MSEQSEQPETSPKVTRREFLRRTAVGAAASLAGGVLGERLGTALTRLASKQKAPTANETPPPPEIPENIRLLMDEINRINQNILRGGEDQLVLAQQRQKIMLSLITNYQKQARELIRSKENVNAREMLQSSLPPTTPKAQLDDLIEKEVTEFTGNFREVPDYQPSEQGSYPFADADGRPFALLTNQDLTKLAKSDSLVSVDGIKLRNVLLADEGGVTVSQPK